MRITHIAPVGAAAPQPRINTLRPVSEDDGLFHINQKSVPVSDMDEVHAIILHEYSPIFEKLQQLHNQVQAYLTELEEKEGYTNAVKRLASAVEEIENLPLARAKDAKFMLQSALNMMPDILSVNVMLQNCENPFLSLEEDFM